MRGYVYIKIATKDKFDSPVIEKQVRAEVIEGDPELHERITVLAKINRQEHKRVVEPGAYSTEPITMNYL